MEPLTPVKQSLVEKFFNLLILAGEFSMSMMVLLAMAFFSLFAGSPEPSAFPVDDGRAS